MARDAGRQIHAQMRNQGTHHAGRALGAVQNGDLIFCGKFNDFRENLEIPGHNDRGRMRSEQRVHMRAALIFGKCLKITDLRHTEDLNPARVKIFIITGQQQPGTVDLRRDNGDVLDIARSIHNLQLHLFDYFGKRNAELRHKTT